MMQSTASLVVTFTKVHQGGLYAGTKDSRPDDGYAGVRCYKYRNGECDCTRYRLVDAVQQEPVVRGRRRTGRFLVAVSSNLVKVAKAATSGADGLPGTLAKVALKPVKGETETRPERLRGVEGEPTLVAGLSQVEPSAENGERRPPRNDEVGDADAEDRSEGDRR